MAIFDQALCPLIQEKLVDKFGMNAPMFKYKRLGFLQAITSNAMTAGTTQIQLDGGVGGKIRQVQLIYDTPYCLGVAQKSYNCVDVDTATNNQQPGLASRLVTLPANPFILVDGSGNPTRLMFDKNEMRKICEGEGELMVRHIMAFLRNLEEGMNNALLEQFAPLVGKFADGSGLKGIPLFANDAGGISQALLSATEKLEQEYSDISATGLPILVGHTIPRNYAQRLKWGCCNLQGVNMANASGGFYFFDDQFIDGAVGANDFFLLAPNSVQLVTWNKYIVDQAENTDVYQAGAITSPFTGITYDMRVFWDVKCEKYFVELMSFSQMVVSPAGGCGIAGANGTLAFHACAEAEEFSCATS